MTEQAELTRPETREHAPDGQSSDRRAGQNLRSETSLEDAQPRLQLRTRLS